MPGSERERRDSLSVLNVRRNSLTPQQDDAGPRFHPSISGDQCNIYDALCKNDFDEHDLYAYRNHKRIRFFPPHVHEEILQTVVPADSDVLPELPTVVPLASDELEPDYDEDGKLTLAKVLSVYAYRVALYKYMCDEHCEENLNFLRAVLTYKILYSVNAHIVEAQDYAKDIVNVYFNSNSADCVNIDPPLYDDVRTRIRKSQFSICLFDRAFISVHRIIDYGVYRRFIDSDAYEKMLERGEEDASVGLTDSDLVPANITLHRMLVNPVYRSAFIEYVESEHAEENFWFLEQIIAFRTIAARRKQSSPAVIIQLAKELYDKFITHKHSSTTKTDLVVCLSFTIRSDIEKKIQSASLALEQHEAEYASLAHSLSPALNLSTPQQIPSSPSPFPSIMLDHTLFDAAYNSVFHELLHGPYARFVNTPMYSNLKRLGLPLEVNGSMGATSPSIADDLTLFQSIVDSHSLLAKSTSMLQVNDAGVVTVEDEIMNFDDFLLVPSNVAAFEQFMVSEFTIDELHCFQAINRYKSTPFSTAPAMIAAANNIVSIYLHSESAEAITIDSSLIVELESVLLSCSAAPPSSPPTAQYLSSIFDDILRHVKQMMQRGSYARFIETPQYRSLRESSNAGLSRRPPRSQLLSSNRERNQPSSSINSSVVPASHLDHGIKRGRGSINSPNYIRLLAPKRASLIVSSRSHSITNINPMNSILSSLSSSPSISPEIPVPFPSAGGRELDSNCSPFSSVSSLFGFLIDPQRRTKISEVCEQTCLTAPTDSSLLQCSVAMKAMLSIFKYHCHVSSSSNMLDESELSIFAERVLSEVTAHSTSLHSASSSMSPAALLALHFQFSALDYDSLYNQIQQEACDQHSFAPLANTIFNHLQRCNADSSPAFFPFLGASLQPSLSS